VTFLYSATTHRCLNLLRNRRTRARLLEARGTTAAPAGEARAGPAEAMAQVRQLLARMPEDLAEVAVHYFVDEMTHDEIAEVIGCSRRKVGVMVERARASAWEAEAR
jgi:RNA polymerase sigma-70 factor (ECF subfamily)